MSFSHIHIFAERHNLDRQLSVAGSLVLPKLPPLRLGDSAVEFGLAETAGSGLKFALFTAKQPCLGFFDSRGFAVISQFPIPTFASWRDFTRRPRNSTRSTPHRRGRQRRGRTPRSPEPRRGGSRGVHTGPYIEFDGQDYEIAPTSRKVVTVLFHPFRKLWVLDHSPKLTWPPILGHFTLKSV